MQNKYYAAKINSEHINDSSSGGVFYSLASKVIEEGGVVFGAAFDDKFKVVHKMIEGIDSLKDLQGSKYVQSDLGNSFKEVLQFLNQGRNVLFSGTPCQIAGLNSFLNITGHKDKSKLLTVEIVCHGVPSGGIFRDYITNLQVEEKLKKFSFRSKDKNKNFVIGLEFENGKKIYKNALLDPFYASFLADLTLRQTCYKCHFCGPERIADITLGDFWGIEKVKTSLSNPQGASLLVCNSARGYTYFRKIENCMNYSEVTFDDATKLQPQLRNVNRFYKMPTKRNEIFESWKNRPTNEFLDKLKKESINKKKVLFNCIPAPLVKIIKRFI